MEHQAYRNQKALKQLSQQFKQSQLEQQKYAELLEHEQQFHKKKLSDKKGNMRMLLN